MDDAVMINGGTFTDEAQARHAVRQLLSMKADAEQAAELAKRQARGIRKMIDGLVMIFPDLDEMLPSDWPCQKS